MRTYKLLQLFFIGLVLGSCSQDSLDPTATDVTNDRLAFTSFDTSYLGTYKGVFTTQDGLTRGSLVLTLNENQEGNAQLTLSTGEVIALQSNRVKLTADNKVSNLQFSSASSNASAASFEFSVEGDGQQPRVTNVFLNSNSSDILIAKNLQRAPLTPIVGTYVCTNCQEVGQGFPVNNLTWNVMSIGEGDDQNFMIQLSYGGRVYTSNNNLQTNCSTVGGLTTCDVNGAIDILGYTVTWSGTHTYSSGNGADCSSITGTWSAPAYGPGVYGTLVSDTQCTDSSPSPTSVTYASCNEKITDHAVLDDYGPNRFDVYYVDAGEGNIASLYFNEFDLEEGRDFLQIYDGKNTYSPIITVSDVGTPSTPQGFTGTGFTGANSLDQQKIYATGQYLTLVFTSNESGSRAGFVATINCID
ncbi:MAG: CUB domain-containing protein [Aquaticitalea sp.]